MLLRSPQEATKARAKLDGHVLITTLFLIKDNAFTRPRLIPEIEREVYDAVPSGWTHTISAQAGTKDQDFSTTRKLPNHAVLSCEPKTAVSIFVPSL